jgi:hypothetical protein
MYIKDQDIKWRLRKNPAKKQRQERKAASNKEKKVQVES